MLGYKHLQDFVDGWLEMDPEEYLSRDAIGEYFENFYVIDAKEEEVREGVKEVVNKVLEETGTTLEEENAEKIEKGLRNLYYVGVIACHDRLDDLVDKEGWR